MDYVDYSPELTDGWEFTGGKSQELSALLDDADDADYLVASPLFDGNDDAGTSILQLNPTDALDGSWMSPVYDVAELPPDPLTNPAYACPAGTALACCFNGALRECIWYKPDDPGCFYETDFRCCADIEGLEGKGCKVAPSAQEGNAVVNMILDFLRTDVDPSAWLWPLIGDATEGIFNGI